MTSAFNQSAVMTLKQPYEHVRILINYRLHNALLEISLRDRIPNEEIRRRTNLTDMRKRVSQLKWRWVEHIASNREMDIQNPVWRPRKGNRSIDRLQKRWGDEIRKKWMRIATSRQKWKYMEDAYILKWMITRW